MYIGPFYFDTKELFLVFAVGLLALALYLNWPLWEFDARLLLTLAVVFLLTKGLLPSIHNEAFFLHAVVTIFLTLFIPNFLQILLFYFLTFFVLRLMKVV